jgi:hypothetical protein
MQKPLSIVVLALVGAVSCSDDTTSSPHDSSGPPYVVSIGVMQESGLTNADPGHAVRLIVHAGSDRRAEFQGLLSTIATFDGQPSAVETTNEDPMVFHVSPQSPLAEGWHELKLTSAEYETGGSDETGWNDSTGAFHHRFFVGSAPYVKSVYLSPDKAKGGSVVIRFSEPVEFGGLATGLDVSLDGSAVEACPEGPSGCLSSTTTAEGDSIWFRLDPGPSAGVKPQAFSISFPAATSGAEITFAQAMSLVSFDGEASGSVMSGSEMTLSLSQSDWRDCDAGLCWTSALAIPE